MKVGFIGYGEAAFNISSGLGNEGITGIRATDIMMNHEIMGKQIHNRAQEAGVILVETNREIAQWADIIFVAVPSSFAMEVCNDIKDCLLPGQLYIDVSASTPAVKQAIWEVIKDKGVNFSDAAMLGSLPKDKHNVPITASGNGAKIFYELMTPYGMKITAIDKEAGAASAIKLVRSIFMKGIASLMIDTMKAAEAYGVSEEIVKSIGKSLDGIPFQDHLDRLITGTALHCIRRANELKGSVSMLEEAGLSSEMTLATKHGHEALEKYDFATRFVNTKLTKWQEVIEIICSEKRQEEL